MFDFVDPKPDKLQYFNLNSNDFISYPFQVFQNGVLSICLADWSEDICELTIKAFKCPRGSFLIQGMKGQFLGQSCSKKFYIYLFQISILLTREKRLTNSASSRFHTIHRLLSGIIGMS